MGRTKSIRYNALKDNKFVIDESQELFFRLKWKRNQTFFKNKNPIVVELACGKWEYTIGMAKQFSNKNYLWIDIKWERIFIWASLVEELGLANAWFIRMNINDLRNIFAEWEVDDIWLIHPDPRPKNSDRNRRLTSPKFLSIYQNILKKWWKLRLKTDDLEFFKYSLEMFIKHWFNIKCLTFDLYNSDLYQEHYWIKTNYEKLFVAKWRKINYVVCE